MDVDDYRKQFAAQIAGKTASRSPSLWMTEVRSAGSESSISARIEQLRNSELESDERNRALRQLQAAAFTGPKFGPFQASFIQALRFIATNKDDPLRQSALEHLSAESDPVARQILTEGLTDPTKAAVSDAKALQLLAQDDHADAASLAREVFSKTDDPGAKEEAVRAMASDPAAIGLLTDIVKNQALPDQLRSLGASGLRVLDPQAFQSEALRIISDEKESDALKTQYLVILDRLNGAGALGRDVSDALEHLSQMTQDAPLKNVLNKLLDRR